jgi:hypothetical protein
VGALAAGSVLTDAWTAAMGLGTLALAVVVRLVYECGAAAATVDRTLREPAPAPGSATVLIGSQLPQAG